MASSSRSSRLQRLHRALGQRYQAVSPADRSVLELVLYAICLDGASHDAAEQALESIVRAFYDFNEARVSSTQELSERLAMLPTPRDTAQRIRAVLQTLFETTYTFDMEAFRKMDAAEFFVTLQKYAGISRFSVLYVAQLLFHLGCVPVSGTTFRLLKDLGVATDEDVSTGEYPGADRQLSKAASAEFCSLLHQAGVEYAKDPFAPGLRELLIEIFPDAESTLPKPPVVEVVLESTPVANTKKPKKKKTATEKSVGGEGECSAVAGTTTEGNAAGAKSVRDENVGEKASVEGETLVLKPEAMTKKKASTGKCSPKSTAAEGTTTPEKKKRTAKSTSGKNGSNGGGRSPLAAKVESLLAGEKAGTRVASEERTAADGKAGSKKRTAKSATKETAGIDDAAGENLSLAESSVSDSVLEKSAVDSAVVSAADGKVGPKKRTAKSATKGTAGIDGAAGENLSLAESSVSDSVLEKSVVNSAVVGKTGSKRRTTKAAKTAVDSESEKTGENSAEMAAVDGATAEIASDGAPRAEKDKIAEKKTTKSKVAKETPELAKTPSVESVNVETPQVGETPVECAPKATKPKARSSKKSGGMATRATATRATASNSDTVADGGANSVPGKMNLAVVAEAAAVEDGLNKEDGRSGLARRKEPPPKLVTEDSTASGNDSDGQGGEDSNSGVRRKPR